MAAQRSYLFKISGIGPVSEFSAMAKRGSAVFVQGIQLLSLNFLAVFAGY